jgi:hypothetical protein
MEIPQHSMLLGRAMLSVTVSGRITPKPFAGFPAPLIKAM